MPLRLRDAELAMGSGLSGGLTRRGVALLASFILLSSPLFINSNPRDSYFANAPRRQASGQVSQLILHVVRRKMHPSHFSSLLLLAVTRFPDHRLLVPLNLVTTQQQGFWHSQVACRS